MKTDEHRAVASTSLVGLGDLPSEDLDFNDWGEWGDGNWHFFEGNEMDGHRRIASVPPNPGHMPHWNGCAWTWKPNVPDQATASK